MKSIRMLAMVAAMALAISAHAAQPKLDLPKPLPCDFSAAKGSPVFAGIMVHTNLQSALLSVGLAAYGQKIDMNLQNDVARQCYQGALPLVHGTSLEQPIIQAYASWIGLFSSRTPRNESKMEDSLAMLQAAIDGYQATDPKK